MRKALDHLSEYRDHAGLAYDVRAPVDADGKLVQKRVDAWLNEICKPGIPLGYERAFQRWQASFRPGRDVLLEASAESRLLIGHGNPAPTEVGITLHHTWGVPVIPGSALKGLTAHFVAACYGADAGEQAPERTLFAGPTYSEDGRVTVQPGDTYRHLFGAPAVPGPDGTLLRAYQGKVVFHDALWIPQRDRPWLARDVLTVHQQSYYRERSRPPNDYDNPNPVAFIDVPPGEMFLVALSCEDDALRQMAARFVEEALCDWGVGGKTAAGYGRMSVRNTKVRAPQARASGSPVLAELEGWLREHKQVSHREQLERIEHEWLARLQALPPAAHDQVEKLMNKQFKKSKRGEQRDALIRKIRQR